MKELHEQVERLVACREKEMQIKSLQDIGKTLLTEYVLKIDNIIIEPLWVEAYYFNPLVGFEDGSMHRDARQKEWDVLYFHQKTNGPRNGVDICLSQGDYYLSYLIKFGLVDGVLKTQSQLANMIAFEQREMSPILCKQYRPTDIVQCTARVGITSGGYESEALAVVRDFNQAFVNENGENKSMPKKIELLKAYILANYPLENRMTEAQKKAISQALVGENWVNDLFN